MWFKSARASDGRGPDKPKQKYYPNRLKEWMDLRGLNDEDMAKLSRISVGNVYKLRAGDRVLTPYNYLIPFAAILGVRMEDLILPTKECLDKLESIRTAKDTPDDVRASIALALAQWTQRIQQSQD